MASEIDRERKEESHGVVIVGAGICGLATAVALHRKGIKSLVLERSEHLRVEGAAIGIRGNGWRALDYLQVGDELREKSTITITRLQRQLLGKTKPAQVMNCRDEFRCVKRSDLVETLAKNLPAGSIRFGCEVISISLDSTATFPIIATRDGKTIRTKVLIGCDGSNSVVAQHLGLAQSQHFPVWATRGLTEFTDGRRIENHVLLTQGKNTGFGRIPITDKLVHFFVINLRQTEPVAIKSLEGIYDHAMTSLQGFPAEMTDIVKQCNVESLSLSRVWYRAPWHLLFNSFQKGTVTVAGDAMHVMGPFLGLGGAVGLEDAIVLARSISEAVPGGAADLASGDSKLLFGNINAAIQSYVRKRRARIVWLSTHSYLLGMMLTGKNLIAKVLCFAVLAMFFGMNSWSYAEFDCGPL